MADSDLSGIEGVTVYDQETFEENVSKKLSDFVDKQKREQDLKNLHKESKSVNESLFKATQDLSKVEDQLKNAVSRGITSDRRLQLIIDQQEKFKLEILNLTKSKNEIQAALELIQTEESNVQESNDVEKESKREKSIRLGQMTAFGTVLASKSEQDNDDNNFLKGRNYVKDWMDTEEDQAPESVAQPKSKLRQLLEKPKDQKDPQDPDLDSDWESESDSEISPLKKLRTKTRNSETIDDGDRDLYIQRLQAWQDSRTKSDTDLDSKYEELDGGLRVPLRIWKNLYHYQKVAVQWMWELHQQDVGGILGDEMGLGKTIQLCAFLASLSYSAKKMRQCRLGPVLIVCPTTGKVKNFR